MINSNGSDWLISSSAEELNEKINGILTKFIFRKINSSNFIYRRIGSYDIVSIICLKLDKNIQHIKFCLFSLQHKFKYLHILKWK